MLAPLVGALSVSNINHWKKKMNHEPYVTPVPKGAVGFSAVRFFKNGSSRAYDTVTFGDESDGETPRLTLDKIYRQMKVFGCIANDEKKAGGLMDIVDSNLDMIDNIYLTSKGVSYVCKTYGLRVLKLN